MNFSDNITRSHAQTSEKAIERRLARKVKEAGGLCLKFYSATEAGYPDRLCLMPGGLCAWAEIKSKGRKPRELQKLRIGELRRMGFEAVVLDSPERVDSFVERLKDACDEI